MRTTKLLVFGLLALLLAAPALAQKEHKINLRLKAATLEEGDNSIYTFESMGQLFARSSGKGIAGYDLDTFTRMRLPMKKTGTKEEVTEAPAGSVDPDCIEWRERCYSHAGVKIQVCDMVCTKIYDKATKTVVPVTDPETVYVAITSNVVNFRDSAFKSDNPVYMKPRNQNP